LTNPSQETIASTPGPGWGAGRVFAGLVAVLVLILVWASAVSLVDPDLESLAATLVLQALVAITFVGVAFVAATPEPRSEAARALGLRRPLHPAIKYSAIAYLAYIGCALVIAVVLEPEQDDITRDLGYGESVLGSVAAGFLIVAVAPFTEELFFRGFVFAGLRRGGGFIVAALVSAVVWAFLHFNPDNPEGSWGVVVQLAVFGLALAWLYERTGSVWPPIAIHALNNALAFAILTS